MTDDQAPDLDPGPVPPETGDVQGFAAQIDALPAGLIGRGRYALFKTAEGGLMISFRAEGAAVDGHLPIPPMLLNMARMASEGRGPLGALSKVMARRAGQ